MDFSLDFAILGAFTLLWLAIVPTPGANSILITHIAMTRSMRDVGSAITGNMLGIALLALAALLGWAAALEAFPWLRRAVSFIGGCYLIYLGWHLIVPRRDTRSTSDHKPSAGTSAARSANPGISTFTLGFLTAVSNAQAILFITSIYAVAGILQANIATGLASIVIMLVCNASYLTALAVALRTTPVRSAYLRFRKTLDRIIGALFALLGGRLLLRALD